MPFTQIPEELRRRPQGDLVKILADAGINGDTEVADVGGTKAHFTPGELVIPPNVQQTPEGQELMAQAYKAFLAAGTDIEKYIIDDTGGTELQQIGEAGGPNAATGMQAYFSDDPGQAEAGESGGVAGHGGDDGFGGNDPGGGGPSTGNQTTGDPDFRGEDPHGINNNPAQTTSPDADPLGAADLAEAVAAYSAAHPGFARAAKSYGVDLHDLVDRNRTGNVPDVAAINEDIGFTRDSRHAHNPTRAQRGRNRATQAGFADQNPAVVGAMNAGLSALSAAVPGFGLVSTVGNMVNAATGQPTMGYGAGLAAAAGRGLSDIVGTDDIGQSISEALGSEPIDTAGFGPGGPNDDTGGGGGGDYDPTDDPTGPTDTNIVTTPDAPGQDDQSIAAGTYDPLAALGTPAIQEILARWMGGGANVNAATGLPMYAAPLNVTLDSGVSYGFGSQADADAFLSSLSGVGWSDTDDVAGRAFSAGQSLDEFRGDMAATWNAPGGRGYEDARTAGANDPTSDPDNPQPFADAWQPAASEPAEAVEDEPDSVAPAPVVGVSRLSPLRTRRFAADPRRNSRTGLPMYAGEDNFDADWYRSTYQDVAAAGVDPWEHYQTHGRGEGRLGNQAEQDARDEGFTGSFGGGRYVQWKSDRDYDAATAAGYEGERGANVRAYLDNYADEQPNNPHNVWTTSNTSNIDRFGRDATASRSALRDAGWRGRFGGGGAMDWLTRALELRGRTPTGDIVADARFVQDNYPLGTRPSSTIRGPLTSYATGGSRRGGPGFAGVSPLPWMRGGGSLHASPAPSSGGTFEPYMRPSALTPYRGPGRFAAMPRRAHRGTTLGFGG